ncbi:MAG: FtsX-like permease family protein, partial [Acidobacteria bacterium]|nr:FtsX-like permease family protein [Acidobacteriota bacterium]
FLANEFKQLRTSGLFMPAIFLGVAAFLLSVVLARMVGQQREQIAVLKAFGYTNFQVGLHFFKLVLLVTLVAGLLGVAGGAWMGQAMTGLYEVYFAFPVLRYALQPRYLFQALLIGFAAASLGTLRAIRRAARLPPAEAMRPQAPSGFGPTLVERLGLRRWLSMPELMVLRHLERHPLKAMLSIFGIGCAVALLIVGNAMMDSMDYSMEAEFNVAQREDVTVMLAEPRSRLAHHELQRFPGVLHAEPFRAVAVRLVAGQRTCRTSVTGRPRDATLRRLIDESIRPVPLPEDGLVLTSKLAELLNVKAGDEVWMEVLQEKQQKIRIPVVRVVEAFFGRAAFMNLESLNRRLGEGPVISGAHLLVDESRLDDLHERLKNTPLVAGVGLRKEAIRSFEETAAESMEIMTFFMVMFAVVIACGVVYNNARISLAERSRDLASMRVLGYRRAEISMILLGELWILTLIALPVGCLMGWGLAALSIYGMDNELYSLPLVISMKTYGFACLVVLAASVISSLLVRRRLDRLDLIEVLKARE